MEIGYQWLSKWKVDLDGKEGNKVSLLSLKTLNLQSAMFGFYPVQHPAAWFWSFWKNLQNLEKFADFGVKA